MALPLDLSGNDLIVKSIKTGADAGQAGTDITSGYVSTSGAQTVAGRKTFTDSVNVKQAVTQVNDTTPTAAELTTAFGDPATLGRGFIGTVDDNDGNTNGYLVWCSDASFFFLKGTKAT